MLRRDDLTSHWEELCNQDAAAISAVEMDELFENLIDQLAGPRGNKTDERPMSRESTMAPRLSDDQHVVCPDRLVGDFQFGARTPCLLGIFLIEPDPFLRA